MVDDVLEAMIRYDGKDVRRINHAMKVHAFARHLALAEGLAGRALEVLETAAILHDIGIHEAERKYGSSSGEYQELEGPAVARGLLAGGGLAEDELERVLFLIGHHHTYSAIDGVDFRILVEADFLVNAFEDELASEAIVAARERVFRTKAGIALLDSMY